MERGAGMSLVGHFISGRHWVGMKSQYITAVVLWYILALIPMCEIIVIALGSEKES